MSNAGRRRNSKWDFKEDSRHSTGDERGNDWSGRSGTYSCEKELEPGRFYPEGNARSDSRRSVKDGDDQLNSRHEIRQHSREPWSRSRGPRNGDDMNDDHVHHPKPSTEREGGGNYTTRKSSGFEEYRQQTSHQSPRKDWERSHRSGSRSRSRSRSRSPIYELRRESGFYERSKNRSRVSPQSCEDFADGRYRRGRQFVHQGDQNDEHVWENRNRKARDSKYDDSREQLMRGGRTTEFSSDRYIHDGTSGGVNRRSRPEALRERENNRRDGDALLENHFEGEPHKKSDTPCKFFAAGNCRNGKYCRFSHHSSRDDRSRQDHNRNVVEKRNGPKWRDVDKSDARRSSELETACVSTGISELKGNQNWIDDMEMSPDWNYGVKTLDNTVKEEDSHLAQNSQSPILNNASVPTNEQGRAKEASWDDKLITAPHQLVTENCYLEQESKRGGTNVHPCNDKSALEGHLGSQLDRINAANIMTVQAFNQNGEISGALPYLSSQALGECQVSTPADLSRGLSTNYAENMTEFHEKNFTSKPDIGNVETSQVDCGNVLTQSMVTSEQLNQITSNPAFLAQFFGNGQQLPQLYSSSNLQNAVQVPSLTKSEGHIKLDSSVIIQPNQAATIQHQYEPIGGDVTSMEHDIGNGTGEVPETTAEQINTADTNRGHPNNLTSSVPLSPSSEKEPTDGNNQLDPNGNSKVSEENGGVRAEESNKAQDRSKNAQETGAIENDDGDGRADEGKKTKDTKGVRAFKFALVEHVKELLKPTWKEGRMSKDAYKNIVKKVVDKVTGAIQDANIPQTQEKIDQYLSASKPKLTKLVQAYVNKFQKS